MDNRRGILLMVAAMAGFAVEDMFVKAASATVPVGQIIAVIGLAGLVAFALLVWRQGQSLLSPALLTGPVMLRNLGEAVGTVGFVMAIVLTPLTSASAILQATPLVITAGAALFLGEDVRWRRWTAIAFGLVGVLMIVRPGLEGFMPASLFAVVGVAGLSLRDLATRVVPREVSSAQLSAWAFATAIVTGTILALIGGAPLALPSAGAAAMLLGAAAFGLAAYWAITQSMRAGELSVVAPFRYTRLIFALILGALAFGERPDVWTLAGAALIIGSGLYTLSRERRTRRARTPTGSPTRTDLRT
ncbi:DMT family transporter [Roseitranquillus sediminis]|uniref:DMT family transporter n=1 Tax=Roseitranquillus sediminis TaxID=2809051 RepID=UPI001D0BFD51|nr:DMT family transporter [Roseitranquillus sediminis]MBM9596073.1 DMT family transporter [Roseitranquillus sediminis]